MPGFFFVFFDELSRRRPAMLCDYPAMRLLMAYVPSPLYAKHLLFSPQSQVFGSLSSQNSFRWQDVTCLLNLIYGAGGT